MTRKVQTKAKVSKSPRKTKGLMQSHSVFQFFNKINGLTKNQDTAILDWRNGKNLILSGYAGTGKTFLALSLASEELVEGNTKRIILIRSAVPTRDIGFLPGTADEKLSVYEAPYVSMFSEIYSRGDAIMELKSKGLICVESTSFLRGITFDNSIIVVDECQNMTFHEINTVMTRMGEDSRIIFAGDIRQSDIRGSGIEKFFNIVSRMDPRYFSKIEFTAGDIVRSGIVKDYIIAAEGVD
jgi:predicted ribonuclease YlaK